MYIKKLLSITSAVAIFMGAFAGCSNDKDNVSKVRDITTMELVHDMGLGINLGNTLEACGDWIDGKTVSDFEVAWGSPIVTKELVDGYAKAGFKSVRIPIAWSNLIADDYTIDEGLMNRVEEVVNYVLDNKMYAIINIHWDGGWWEKFSTDYDGCMEKYTKIWNQINERFKNYNDYLIFESLNEEGCFNDLWNRYSGSDDGKSDAFGILNSINQEFVNLVRSSGGNNDERHLLIAGYATDVELTCDPAFVMPNDPKNKCAVSVHYYTPSTFCILEEDADWGKARPNWGTQHDMDELVYYMDMLEDTFVDNDIPVIIGEYGCTIGNKTDETVRNFITAVASEAYSRGICPMLWDTTDTFYDRTEFKIIDPELQKNFNEIVAK